MAKQKVQKFVSVSPSSKAGRMEMSQVHQILSLAIGLAIIRTPHQIAKLEMTWSLLIFKHFIFEHFLLMLVSFSNTVPEISSV